MTPGAKGPGARSPRPRPSVTRRPRRGRPGPVQQPREPAIHCHDGPGDLGRPNAVDILVSGVGTGGTITGAGQPEEPDPHDQGRRRRAGGVARPQWRRAQPAQDPGHRRRLRARGAQQERLRRGPDGHERGRHRGGAPAAVTEGIFGGISSGAALHAAVPPARQASRGYWQADRRRAAGLRRSPCPRRSARSRRCPWPRGSRVVGPSTAASDRRVRAPSAS